MEAALIGGVLGAIAVVFVAARWIRRVDHLGTYGAGIGAAMGIRWHDDDPTGMTRRLPHLDGVRRRPVATGSHGRSARAAMVDETVDGVTELVFHVWVLVDPTMVDADVVRRPDGTLERTHGTRHGQGDRIVRLIAERVPDARLIWCRDGANAAVGVAIDGDLMTNPVAWTNWMDLVVRSVNAGTRPPDAPAVGFG